MTAYYTPFPVDCQTSFVTASNSKFETFDRDWGSLQATLVAAYIFCNFAFLNSPGVALFGKKIVIDWRFLELFTKILVLMRLHSFSGKR